MPEHAISKTIDAVFEGGGVKGSALIGAIAATEQLGYQFSNIAGTSAGAIIGALLAAGYRAEEMKTIMDELDYALFKDKGIIGSVPLIGVPLQILLKKGLYEGDFFQNWLANLLAKRNVRTFGDIIMPEFANEPPYRYKLQVITSDISRGKLVILPQDAKEYGINPDALSVAQAVRMSMSIPFFYKPVVVRANKGTSYLVDGGILSNFPVWIFDEGPDDAWPTIGYKLVEPDEGRPHAITGIVSLASALFSTMMEAHDARYIKDSNFMRTVPIPTLGVQTTDFSLPSTKRAELYQSGFTAAQDFFASWNFGKYKEQRAEENVSASRRKRLRG
jgi:NTE family protein